MHLIDPLMKIKFPQHFCASTRHPIHISEDDLAIEKIVWGVLRTMFNLEGYPLFEPWIKIKFPKSYCASACHPFIFRKRWFNYCKNCTKSFMKRVFCVKNVIFCNLLTPRILMKFLKPNYTSTGHIQSYSKRWFG